MFTRADQTVTEILAILEQGRDMHYGEDVTQLEHALQCAKLAVDSGSEDETILAALLHDIGHIHAPDEAEAMDELGVVDHEAVGANYLRQAGFSEKIAQLVESHVDAKRYLTFKYPGYYTQLSAASKKTLHYQGGPMSAAEAAAFEQDPLFEAKLRLRSWDENGKNLGSDVPPAETYRDMMLRHLTQRGD